MVERLKFEASANLQRLIGRELVPDETHALVELVKNAYDSDASHVEITIQPETSREPGYIQVLDDGSGMSKAVIQQHFMWAGNSERIDNVNGASRVPTGEKGIGRFAADRLGSRLVVRTLQSDASKGLELDIDWKLFEDRKKRFNDIEATVKPSDVRDVGEHGTLLRITRLRARWDAARVAVVRQHLRDLLDPFEPPKDFTIAVEMPGNPNISGPIIQEQPGDADIEVSFRVLKSGEVRRNITDRTAGKSRSIDSPNRKVDGEKLWGVTGHFRYYLKRPNKKAVGGLDAGVRLYRDGFRVEPFGSPAADWLGISEKRAKRAGHAQQRHVSWWPEG